MRLTNNTLVNKVDLYHFVPTQDADAAVVGTIASAYPTAFATSVRCSAQPASPERMTDQERIGAKSVWRVVFGSAQPLAVNDLILYVDRNGTTRYLIVTLLRDLAGRGGAFEARCEERS